LLSVAGPRERDTLSLHDALPILARGARLVVASHLGRPKGKPVAEYSLEPVAAHLAELLGIEVSLTDEPTGDGARKVVADLRDGRSEEHTSELQSRENLVCRLLLE